MCSPLEVTMFKILRVLAYPFIAAYRLAWGIVAAVRLILDPDRLDAVFVLDRAVSTPKTLRRIRDRIANEPTAALALGTRPRLGPLSVGDLASRPEGSLGRAYADFMQRRGLDPRSIPEMPSGDEI